MIFNAKAIYDVDVVSSVDEYDVSLNRVKQFFDDNVHNIFCLSSLSFALGDKKNNKRLFFLYNATRCSISICLFKDYQKVKQYDYDENDCISSLYRIIYFLEFAYKCFKEEL